MDHQNLAEPGGLPLKAEKDGNYPGPLSPPSSLLRCPQECLGLLELEEHCGEELQPHSTQGLGLLSSLCGGGPEPSLKQNRQLDLSAHEEGN